MNTMPNMNRGIEPVPGRYPPPIPPPAPRKQEKFLTEQEEYRVEKKRKREQQVMHAILQYSKTLKKYGILSSLEDGATDMDRYTERYGTDTIEKHRQYANMVKQKEGKTEYWKNSEYLEKIIPINLLKTTEYFLDEIDNIKEFYKKYRFSTKEKDVYNHLLQFIPQDMVVRIAAPYDDVYHGIDFSIDGDFPLCGVDVTTKTSKTKRGEVEIEEKKLREIIQHNEEGPSEFYGVAFDEEKGIYVPMESIANIPLLYLALPGNLIPNLIDKTHSQTDHAVKNLQFSKYIIGQLAKSLRTVQHKTRLDKKSIARHIKKAENALSLPKGTMEIEDKVEQALQDRYECENILNAFFYCTDQFFAKKLGMKPLVEIPQTLLE